MLATSARSVPCSAPASAFAALNLSSSPFFSIVTSGPKVRDSVPSGPFTEISPAASVTSTFGGSLTGLLPIRDMALSALRDDAEDFAADTRGARLAVRHHAVRCGYDRDAEPVHHRRDVVLALVDAEPRLADALDARDDRMAGVVLERDFEHRSRVGADLVALDVALVLQ